MPRDPIEMGRAARRITAAAMEGAPMTEKKALTDPAAVRVLARAGRTEQDVGCRPATRTGLSAITYEEGVLPGTDRLGPPDEEMERFLGTQASHQITMPGTSLTGYSIHEEIAEVGTLRPFVEGEPIGCINTDPPRGPAKDLRTRAEIMEGRRKEMLEMRAANEAKLAALDRRVR